MSVKSPQELPLVCLYIARKPEEKSASSWDLFHVRQRFIVHRVPSVLGEFSSFLNQQPGISFGLIYKHHFGVTSHAVCVLHFNFIDLLYANQPGFAIFSAHTVEHTQLNFMSLLIRRHSKLRHNYDDDD